MAKREASADDRHRAAEHAKLGRQAYEEWDIDTAIKHYNIAARLYPDEPLYLLHLARTLARGGDFDRALKALAEFIRLEPDSPLAERFEKLFASGMDDVELLLTDKMTADGMPIEIVGAAIQLWLEYRIALGSESLPLRKPATWAAGLDYTVRKVNLRPVKRKDIAALYGVSEATLRDRHDSLVSTLDVMPCDYRYFAGDKNPLDKLVEAAELLDQLEERFREP